MPADIKDVIGIYQDFEQNIRFLFVYSRIPHFGKPYIFAKLD